MERYFGMVFPFNFFHFERWEFYWTQAAITLLLQVILFSFGAWQLFKVWNLRKEKKTTPWLTIIIISCVLCGVIRKIRSCPKKLTSLVRFIYHVIDPYAIRGYFTPISENVWLHPFHSSNNADHLRLCTHFLVHLWISPSIILVSQISTLLTFPGSIWPDTPKCPDRFLSFAWKCRW